MDGTGRKLLVPMYLSISAGSTTPVDSATCTKSEVENIICRQLSSIGMYPTEMLSHQFCKSQHTGIAFVGSGPILGIEQDTTSMHSCIGSRRYLRGGGGTDDGAFVSTHSLGRSGGMLPKKYF